MRFSPAYLLPASAALVALGILTVVSRGASPVLYEVSLVGEASREISVRVKLRRIARRSSLHVFSRAADLHIQDQIYDIFCDEVPLRMERKRAVAIPENCSVLSWKSRMEVIGEDGILVEQQSFQSAGGEWGLLSGPASLLRFAPVSQSPRLKMTGGDGAVLYKGVLPPTSRPPFFLPFGDWATGHAELQAFKIVYHVDDPAFLGGADPWPEHLSGLKYFAGLLQLAPGDQSLHVVWVGRRDEENNINGAAGERVLLVNYTRNGDHLTARDRMRALFVLLHEQFHQIDPGGGGGESWYGESVSSYYALKALRRQAGEAALLDEIWAEFIDIDRLVVHTFRDIERQMATGDRSNSFLVYTQGATFWFALDELISAETGGAESLDDYIGEIKHLRFESAEGSLPAVIRILPASISNDVMLLMEKYVG